MKRRTFLSYLGGIGASLFAGKATFGRSTEVVNATGLIGVVVVIANEKSSLVSIARKA